MSETINPKLEDQMFALRTTLVLLSTTIADRFPHGEFASRVEKLIEEADMRGGESRFEETRMLLSTILANIPHKP